MFTRGYPSFFAPSPPVPRLRTPGRAACGAAGGAAGGAPAASEPHPAAGHGKNQLFLVAKTIKNLEDVEIYP